MSDWPSPKGTRHRAGRRLAAGALAIATATGVAVAFASIALAFRFHRSKQVRHGVAYR